MAKIKVGFTGSRHGMTQEQYDELKKIIKAKEISEFHHGMCIGSDLRAHDHVDSVKKDRGIKIVGHPPRYKGSYAKCKCNLFTIELTSL